MLVSSHPIGDWQFWVVTAIALLAMLWIARGLLRVVRPRKRRAAKGRRATLTIAGRPVEPSGDRRGPRA